MSTSIRTLLRPVILIMVLAAIAGCSSTTIAIKEKFGYAKREQLVDGVEKTRDAQEAAKEQFATTLDEFN